MPPTQIWQSEPLTTNGVDLAKERENMALLLGLLVLGSALRLANAAYRFLNADEALHYLLSIQSSLAATYKASLTTVHPPLLIVFLHYWGAIGHSEFVLRLPSIVVGILFCWVMFCWLSRVTDSATAQIAFVLLWMLVFSGPRHRERLDRGHAVFGGRARPGSSNTLFIAYFCNGAGILWAVAACDNAATGSVVDCLDRRAGQRSRSDCIFICHSYFKAESN